MAAAACVGSKKMDLDGSMVGVGSPYQPITPKADD